MQDIAKILQMSITFIQTLIIVLLLMQMGTALCMQQKVSKVAVHLTNVASFFNLPAGLCVASAP